MIQYGELYKNRNGEYTLISEPSNSRQDCQIWVFNRKPEFRLVEDCLYWYECKLKRSC